MNCPVFPTLEPTGPCIVSLPFHQAVVVSEFSRKSVNMNAPVPVATDKAAVEEVPKTPDELHPAIRVFGMILAAVVATAVCYTAVAGVGEVYPTPPEVLSLGGRPTEAELAAASTAQRAADTGNAMVCLGVCGAILGGVLSLSIGRLKRAGSKAAIGVVVGILAGAGLGLLSGKLAVSYHASVTATLHDENSQGANSNSEQQSMMMHGMTWGLIGVGVGLGCGLSHRTIDAKQVILLIIVAGTMGCVAGGVYPIVAGVADPLASSAIPIAPTGLARAIWIGLASLLMAIGVGRAS
jgi:hypothetical protein